MTQGYMSETIFQVNTNYNNKISANVEVLCNFREGFIIINVLLQNLSQLNMHSKSSLSITTNNISIREVAYYYLQNDYYHDHNY